MLVQNTNTLLMVASFLQDLIWLKETPLSHLISAARSLNAVSLAKKGSAIIFCFSVFCGLYLPFVERTELLSLTGLRIFSPLSFSTHLTVCGLPDCPNLRRTRPVVSPTMSNPSLIISITVTVSTFTWAPSNIAAIVMLLDDRRLINGGSVLCFIRNFYNNICFGIICITFICIC